MTARFDRRRFLAASTAAAFATTLGGFAARRAAAGPSAIVTGPYGPLCPVADLETGLPLIQLPDGFQYRSYSWSGDPMSEGGTAPDAHDGMGVIQASGRGEALEVTLVRNHERAFGAAIEAPGRYDKSVPPGQADGPGGGTTTLQFRGRRWVSVEPSLGGTIYNCAGGVTPWGTWLSCEESVIDLSARGGRRHGYVFEVHRDPKRTTGRPIVAMGRMKHEAVAIDPESRIAFLTEDDDKSRSSGFYRFLPKDASGRPGAYEAGGRLQAARVAGVANADLREPSVGDLHRIEWVDVPDPDADPGPPPAGLPAWSTLQSGPFLQGWARGALRMARGEGICRHDGRFYVVDTAAGTDAAGERGRGDGAVWEYDPRAQTLRAIFVSPGQPVADNVDNVTVSPRGGILLCEDGDGVVDAYGKGTRLLGLTQDGDSYAFAKNHVNLSIEQVFGARKRIFPADYRGEEWAGCCFDPAGEVLFANLQRPGITVAIWGPWEQGNL